MLKVMEERVMARRKFRGEGRCYSVKEMILSRSLSSYGWDDDEQREPVNMCLGRNGAPRGVGNGGSEASGQSESDREQSIKSTNQSGTGEINCATRVETSLEQKQLDNNCRRNNVQLEENSNSKSDDECEAALEVEIILEKMINMLDKDNCEFKGMEKNESGLLSDKNQTPNGSVGLSLVNNYNSVAKVFTQDNQRSTSFTSLFEKNRQMTNYNYNAILTNKNGNKKWNYNGISRDNKYEDISDDDDFLNRNQNSGASSAQESISQTVNDSLSADTNKSSSSFQDSHSKQLTTSEFDSCSTTIDTFSSDLPYKSGDEDFSEDEVSSNNSCDCDMADAEIDADVPETNKIVDKALQEFFADEDPDILASQSSLFGRLINGIVVNETETVVLHTPEVISPVTNNEVDTTDNLEVSSHPDSSKSERNLPRRRHRGGKRKRKEKKKKQKIVETREAEVQTIKPSTTSSTTSSSSEKVVSKSGKCYTHVIPLGGDPPRFECKACQRSFTSWDRVRIHAKCKSGVARFVCIVCKSKWHFKSEYNRHLTRHMKAKKSPCPVCEENFKCEYDLCIHMETHQDAPYPSDDKASDSVGGDEVVQNGRDEELLKILEDPSESDNTQGDMPAPSSKVGRKRKARKTYRNKRKRPKVKGDFECDKCDKTYQNIHDLKRHILTHSETPMFKCHLCPKAYKWKSNLTEHNRRDHSTIHTSNSAHDHYEYTRFSSTRLKAIRFPAALLPPPGNMSPPLGRAEVELSDRESNCGAYSPGHDVDTESNYSSYVMSNRTTQVNAFRDWRESSGDEGEVEPQLEATKKLEAIPEKELEESIGVEEEELVAEVEKGLEVEHELEGEEEKTLEVMEVEKAVEAVEVKNKVEEDVELPKKKVLKRSKVVKAPRIREVEPLEGFALMFSSQGIKALTDLFSGNIEPYPF